MFITATESHKQVMIKVNAECDEGVAPLVLALNEIAGIITLDSCEHGVYGEAYVFFTYGKNWQETGKLMQELFICLSKKFCCEYSLRLEWIGNNDCPRAKLICAIEHVGSIADTIRSSAFQINDHMTVSVHGK